MGGGHFGGGMGGGHFGGGFGGGRVGGGFRHGHFARGGGFGVPYSYYNDYGYDDYADGCWLPDRVRPGRLRYVC